MALTIDSAEVLRAFADHPDAFPAIRADIGEFARKLLLKQVKAKTTDLAGLRLMQRFAGETNLKTILDELSVTELAGLIKRIDPHSPLAKKADDAVAARRHVIALGAGAVEPAAMPEKVAKPKPRPRKTTTPAASTSKIGVLLESEVHSGRPRSTPRARKPS